MMRIVAMAVLAAALCMLTECEARLHPAGAAEAKAPRDIRVAESERAWAESPAREILADIDAGRYEGLWDAGAPAMHAEMARDDFVRSTLVAREYSGNWGARLRKTLVFYTRPGRSSLHATLVNQVECGGGTCEERVFMQRIDLGLGLSAYSVEPAL